MLNAKVSEAMCVSLRDSYEWRERDRAYRAAETKANPWAVVVAYVVISLLTLTTA